MTAPEVHVVGADPARALGPVLDAVRRELDVPESFPPEVLAAAEASARAGGAAPPDVAGEAEDRTDLELVTIDPPGSRDLDQAYLGERLPGGGFRVHYAIADVAWFVPAGGPVDVEARRRGVTRYQPDLRTPLHPPVLGEGAASLLPGEERPALLWTIDLDADGVPVGDARFRRARVRSRAALGYPDVQRRLDDGEADDPLVVLRDVGQRREAREADRGGINLRLPAQEVVLDHDRPELAFRSPLPVEGWNAQISLLAGMTAAGIMLAGGVGLLRTLPAPAPEALADLRRRAAALGVEWPEAVTYPDFVRGLDPDDPVGAVLLRRAARTLRGAGYEAFDGAPPPHPVHAAVASPYAHVTAPLRRLADRHANEVLLALVAGREPPAWARDALGELPGLMGEAAQRERALDGAVLDAVEALVLAPRVGEVFEATVVAVDVRDDRATIQIRDPAVVASVGGSHPVGAQLGVRLVAADPMVRRVTFEPA